MRNLLCLAFVSLLPACDAAYGDDHESSGSAGYSRAVVEIYFDVNGNECFDYEGPNAVLTCVCPDGFTHVGWSRPNADKEEHAVCLED